MNRFPLDASRFPSILTAGPVAEVQEYQDGAATGRQQADENGVPLWRATFLVKTERGIETVAIKWPSKTTPAGFSDDMVPVTVDGLSVLVTKTGTYFSADGVTVNAPGEKKGATA